MTTTQTAEGLIVGTVPYMSPEQARGEKADFPLDQFTLGVMLYEMSSATHPFRRDTAVQTLSAIIADDPPDPALPGSALPTPLRWLIRRLLAKKPRERYAHTADLATDLRNIREFLFEAASAVTVVPPVERPGWRRRLVPGTVAVAVLAGVGLVGRALGTGEAGVGFDRFIPLATDTGYQRAPAWSPDGKQIAYEAEVNGVVQIFTRTIDSGMRTRITDSKVGCSDPSGRRTVYSTTTPRRAIRMRCGASVPSGASPSYSSKALGSRPSLRTARRSRSCVPSRQSRSG